MDNRRFDALAKTLAAPGSRRTLLKSLAGLGLAVLGLRGRAADADAVETGICDAQLARKCTIDADAFHDEQVKNCRGLLRQNPEDPSHSAQLMFSCLAGEQVAYHLALKACQYHRCDASKCEICIDGHCQSACPPGVACIGGQCSGCPEGQHKCGAGCCASDQACCRHVCCTPGVTSCKSDGSCACPNGQKLCAGACIDAASCCTDADCPSGQACHGGGCTPNCAPLGGACATDGSCCAHDGVTCGPFGTCCLSANSFCASDAECCGGHCDPVSGRCCAGAGQGCAVERDCCQLANLTCGASNVCCLPAGQQCRHNQDCCNGNCDQTTGTCCAGNGSVCQVDSDCCGGSCVNGRCCASHLTTCGADGDCCVSTGDICPAGVCCRNAGGACSTIADCCFSGACQNNVCCLADGLDCAQNSDCCGGHCGTDGTCGGCPSGLKQCANMTGCWQCCVDSDCPSGQICHVERCEAASPCGTCPGPAMGHPGCSCDADTSGAFHCLGGDCWQDTPGTCRSCATNGDCPSGFACWKNDLGQQLCLPICAPLN